MPRAGERLDDARVAAQRLVALVELVDGHVRLAVGLVLPRDDPLLAERDARLVDAPVVAVPADHHRLATDRVAGRELPRPSASRARAARSRRSASVRPRPGRGARWPPPSGSRRPSAGRADARARSREPSRDGLGHRSFLLSRDPRRDGPRSRLPAQPSRRRITVQSGSLGAGARGKRRSPRAPAGRPGTKPWSPLKATTATPPGPEQVSARRRLEAPSRNRLPPGAAGRRGRARRALPPGRGL